MRAPELTVIIPNLNGCHHLAECLATLHAQTFTSFETIVIDNGSTDGSVAFCRARYPAVRVIANAGNVGVAAAYNQGIRASAAPFVMTLNNDVALEPGLIAELMRAIQRDERIGIVGAKQLKYQDRGVIDSAGIIIDRYCCSANRGAGERDHGQYERCEEVFAVMCTAAIFRRAMLDDIGLFDEAYVAYEDEFDLAWRARLRGWRCLYVPSARVYHKGGATSIQLGRVVEGVSSFFIVNTHRNRLWTLLKNLGWTSLPLLAPQLALYEARTLWYCLRTANMLPLKARLLALRRLPAVLAERWAIQRRRTAPEGAIRRWMVS